MPVLGRRRLNGIPMGIIPPIGSSPSQVSKLVAGTSTSTSISVGYGAASGSAPITYAGSTSVHGSGSWTKNSGTFSATGGTFTNLSTGTAYDLRIVAINSFGSSTTDLLVGTSTLVVAASTFTVALSRASGSAGASVALTVTPGAGGWPANEVVSPSVVGLAGSFDNTSLVASGISPLTFTFTPASGPGVSGTLSAAAPGMTSTSGAQQYAVTATTTTATANRYDVVVGSSAVGAGAAVPITIYPNAKFPSGSITLAGTNGSFSPSSTITLTAGSGTPVTVTYTPASTGEHAITATNTAGLYNPYPAPLTVFSSASGTALTLSASLTRNDMVTFQRDTPSGNPAGFSLSWARGWGEVWFNITALAGATAGLWIRLYDALSTGATSSTGSGSSLHGSPVQIYGRVSGTGTVRALLPAGPYVYYADIATDSAFTNPIRIAQRFRVGVVFGHFSRSQESGLSRSYAYSGQAPLPTTYAKAAAWVGYDNRYADSDSGWFLHDGVTIDPYQYHYGEASSSGTQEIGRLIESQLGVCVGITGSSAAGGGLDTMVNHDGSLTSGFVGTVAASVGNKFRYLWMATGGWDSVDSTNYPNETHAEIRTRYYGAVDYVARNYPSCAVIGWVTGASGVFGSDGSRLLGYTRNQNIFLNELEPANAMVVSKESYNWNEFYGGHATMGARVQYVRAGFREILAAELSAFGGFQSLNRGPRLSATGTIRAGGRVISIPYDLAGGSALKPVGIDFNNPNYTVNTASSSELATLFAVYLSGGYQGNGTAIRIDSAAINSSAATIDITLTGTSGITFANNSTASMPNALTVQFAADFGASNGSVTTPRAVMITDDRIDTTNGIPYGWHMRPALDIAISTV